MIAQFDHAGSAQQDPFGNKIRIVGCLGRLDQLGNERQALGGSAGTPAGIVPGEQGVRACRRIVGFGSELKRSIGSRLGGSRPLLRAGIRIAVNQLAGKRGIQPGQGGRHTR